MVVCFAVTVQFDSNIRMEINTTRHVTRVIPVQVKLVGSIQFKVNYIEETTCITPYCTSHIAMVIS